MFACMCICAPLCVTLSVETRRRYQILSNWSYRWLKAIMWVLGFEPKTSARATNALNHRASTSPAPIINVHLRIKTNFISFYMYLFIETK